MRLSDFGPVLVAGLCACSANNSTLATSGSGLGAGTCASGSPLAGASYDVARSRFAFGSAPSVEDAGTFVRWMGSDGVVGISSDGSELGIMNAGAPET
ncbi:MAG: hypothetical protein WBY94_03620, partial [Polyangiaceae bacterium]